MAKPKGKKKRSLHKPSASAPAKPKPNPFEVIRPRRKFDVLGRSNQKGVERRVTFARSRAIENRKKTLLVDYQKSLKSSVFKDSRLGEKDASLSEYDKTILRLQREHLSKLKKTRRSSKYNLSDDETDELDVLHGGSVDQRDDFEDDIPSDGSEDEGTTHVPRRLSLGATLQPSDTESLDDEEKPRKSKKEVMREVMLKSKFYKAERQERKEQYINLLNEVDKDIVLIPRPKLDNEEENVENDLSEHLDTDFDLLSKTEALQSLIHSNDKDVAAGSIGERLIQKESIDDYDKLVKELGMEMRARPSENTMTTEQLAQRERQKLEKLEEERKKRMADEGCDADEGYCKKESAERRARSGDDLGDSFSLYGETDKCWVQEIYGRQASQENQDDISDDAETDDGDNDDACSEDDASNGEAEGDSESSDEALSSDEMPNLSVKDWEQSDNDDVAEDEDDHAEEYKGTADDDLVSAVSGRKGKGDLPDSTPEDFDKKGQEGLASLPFVIEAPKTYTELCSLLDDRSETDVTEIIKRIRVCNSAKLDVINRKKMQVFYGVLLQYFAILSTRKPLNILVINALVKPLIEMSAETPYFAAICARQRLLHMRTRLCEDIKESGTSCWPNLKTLLLLRLWSMIFPCSDFRHVVATPLLILMNEYLMRCPIESGRDAAIGAFLCSMVLAVIKESRKFCPEAIMFIQTLLMSCLKSPRQDAYKQVSDQLVELKIVKPLLQLRSEVCEAKHLNLFSVMDMQDDSSYFSSDDFKASALLSVAETLKGFVILYEELISFPEIFSPISDLLHSITQKVKLPDLLSCALEDVVSLIGKTIDKCVMFRLPLQMRKQKPEPVKLLTPKFEEDYVKGLNYDPDKKRALAKKEKKKLRSEKKGLIREFRKDNYFMALVKEKERKDREQERAEQYGKNLSFLQEQEHAAKSGQLGRSRGGKRKR